MTLSITSVSFECHYAECYIFYADFAEYRYAEYRYAEYRYAEYNYAKYCYAEYHSLC